MGSAAEMIRPEADLDTLRAVARGCTACDLYRCGTQTVFGEGEPGARLMLVGEQPGDKEDLAGEPFVGPAGSLLDKALAAAGIERGDAYVTNAVKHFKWKPDPRGGKRRIHAKPNAKEVAACRPWLDAELDRVRPETVVLLGATAAQALLGRQFKVTEQRGRPIAWEGHTVVATVHPSSILRAPDAEARRVQFDGLVADLRVAARRATGRATVRA